MEAGGARVELEGGLLGGGRGVGVWEGLRAAGWSWKGSGEATSSRVSGGRCCEWRLEARSLLGVGARGLLLAARGDG